MVHLGASLAQEKGMTEVQLESQKQEISQLQKKMEENVNMLKIKCKVIDDQTQTIKDLKTEVSEPNVNLKLFVMYPRSPVFIFSLQATPCYKHKMLSS